MKTLVFMRVFTRSDGARGPRNGRVASVLALVHRLPLVRLVVVAWVLWLGATAPAAAVPQAGEHVLLLHGLARGAHSMDSLADHLRESGYRVHNFDYPSTSQSPEELVALLAAEEARCCSGDGLKIHFVTHSLGGILVRAHLEQSAPKNLGRVVLLAPPNQGSEIVDVLSETDLFEVALGPTAAQLGTDADSLPNRIGPPTYEVGIIAGTESINPIGSAILPGDDDGTVSVERTRLEGAADFLLVEATHTFIMQDPEVARQVVRFLRTGQFDHTRP